MDIKAMLTNENYTIVLDTNVLLNIYRYSPEFTDFALNCLKQIQSNIVLPATVRLELGKHCRSEFAKMQSRAKRASNENADQITRAKEKVLSVCGHLARLHFPDIDELTSILSQKMDDTKQALDDFFAERSSLDLISHAWGNIDHVANLITTLDH